MNWFRTIRGGALVRLLLVGLLLVPLVGLSARTPVSAEEPGFLGVTKTASVDTVAPGETFSYTVQVSCTTFGAGCTNAVLDDAVPAPFTVVGQPTLAGTAGTVAVVGQDVSVTFTSPLADPVGSVGLPASSTATITILVTVDPDLPFDQSGIPVDNVAVADGTNTDPAQDIATVTPIVPVLLEADASKSYEPAGALAVPGTETTLTIGATNASNAPVDEIVLVDPVDPTATPNPYTYLALDGEISATLPTGADQVRVDVFVDGAWVEGDTGPTATLPSVDLAAIVGVRVTFSSSTGDQIPVDAGGSAQIGLVQRDAVSGLTDNHTVQNTVTATVGRDDETSEPDTADGQYLISDGSLALSVTKGFTPDQVVAGGSSVVRLGATNLSGRAIEHLRIIEPAGGPGVPFGPGGLTFDGFGTDGAGSDIVWPSGATSATVTYFYDDDTSQTFSTTTVDTLPEPTQPVVGFEIDFAGTIVAGADVTVPVAVTTDADQDVDELVRLNEVGVEISATDGSTGSDSATASITSYVERLAVTVEKKISPARIPSVAGETAVVQLPTQLAPFPDSTTDATSIIVQDPQVVPVLPGPDPWWDAFDAKAITQTAVPAGATLTVRYWDGSQWVVLPGAQDLAGPQIVNLPIPAGLRDQIQGLQFEFSNPEGFPPGTSLQPNFSAELRSARRVGTDPLVGSEDIIENCASATATDGTHSGNAVTPVPCPTIELYPVTGTGDLIDKEWQESIPGSGKTVIARSGDDIDALLSWSTDGRSGLDEVAITDTADPATTAVSDSVFDALDLVAIKPITAALDPLLTYDAVARVELFNGTAWVPAAADPCPGACDGTFPGYTLEPGERATTTGVRLVFVESPTRAARIIGDPTAPQVGDGVARSSDHDRDLLLTFTVRDEARDPQSVPDPVLGSRTYNVPGIPGDVNNTVRATGSTNGAEVVTDTAADIVSIIDVPLNVDVTKDWSGGPLGIPPAGTDPAAYPSGRVSINATNATAAKVDTLTITEPFGAQDPFDEFDVKQIVTIAVPVGATSTTVVLTRDGAPASSHTRTEALALTEAQLANVVGITVTFTGRIDAGGVGRLVFDARLRATDRTTSVPITVADSPVANNTQASVADLGGTSANTPTAEDDASITLAAQGISVVVGKSFAPDVIVEPSKGPITMTLTGKPGGTSRTNLMVLTDDEPLFWNQYDFVGFDPTFALTGPITRVQVDAFTGATFTAGPGGVTRTGGQWQTGDPTTAAAITLPDGVLPAQVQGLRFTFTRADGAIWENPATPLQKAPLQIERRDDLRTGGPVLTDLTGNPPAPGETEPGVASNDVDGYVEGAVLVGGLPITAADHAEASVLYRHSTNGVTVAKSPAGTQPPGVVFDYTLSVTNSGDTTIVDPVITDRLPSDVGGPQLVFDPDTNPGGAGAFGYQLSGPDPDPAVGTPLPTDPDDVTVAITGDVEALTFTFPEGTVLEVGQTYEITISLMFRPGLAGGTQVTNTFGVTGERPWDECSGVLDAATGECRASTTVTVVNAGAIRAVKAVRAVDTELGTATTTPGATCVPDADGFYREPCVPITKPGGDEVWRATMTNTGNLPMDRIVVMDRLPRPGDTGIVNPLARLSAWEPLFEGTVVLANAGPGATLTTWYTTGAPCTLDLNTTGPGCPPGSWNLLPTDPDASLLADITALEFRIDFATPLAPLSSVSVDITTTTPAVSPASGTDTIAWNSVASAGRTVDQGLHATTLATEGNKVGVILATGPLTVVKRVEGPGAAFAPDTFSLVLTCVSAVGTRVETELDLGLDAYLELAADEPITMEDLPWGSTCSVTEDDATALPTDFETTPVQVGRTTDAIELVATNTYVLASLSITKSVETDAVDQDGDAVSYGPFTIGVDCTFLGEDVYATGYDAEEPMTARLDDGEPVTFDGLPARAECTITETDAADAASTSITIEQGDEEPVEIDGTTAMVTLAAGDNAANIATVTNRYDVGSLVIDKVVDGPGAERYGAGPFTVQVTCTLDDASGERTVYDGSVTLGGDDPLTATIEDLATDATCEVVETAFGGATTSEVTPSTVTIGADEPVTVTVTNTFELGSLEVTKELTGPGAERYGAGPFEVTLTCTQDIDGTEVSVDVPGGAVRGLDPDDDPVVYDDLPAGATCELVESATGGATTSTITGDDSTGDDEDASTVEIVAGETAERTIVNDYQVGAVKLVKTLSGSGAAAHAKDVFTFTLTCSRLVDGTDIGVEIPDGATREVSGATSLVATWDDLPVGATCAIAETFSGGADGLSVIIGGSDVTSATAPFTSAPFTLPESDPCVATQAINTWGAEPTTGPAQSAETTAKQVGCNPPAVGNTGAGTGAGAGGTLPRTGNDAWPLVAMALGLLGAGVALASSTRMRDRLAGTWRSQPRG